MMNHLEARLLLRAWLRGMVVATTGETSLGSLGNAFTRVTGSFIGQNFKVGMEVRPTGFADNAPAVILGLTESIMTLRKARPVEGMSEPRSLTVGIPSIQRFENVSKTTDDNLWYIEEDYLPGPSTRIGTTTRGVMEHLPQYVLRLYGIPDTGVAALDTVGDAILARFKPGTAFQMLDGFNLRVRGDVAPERTQVMHDADAARPVTVISIPLLKRSHSPEE